jgi:ubiquinol-cytochrome c reductase cytochrome b subunit
MPNLESNFWGHTISWNIMIPGLILPGLLFNFLYAYPTIEAWITKDKAYHNLLQRPRDTPVRTAIGVAAITAYGVLYVAGQNDVMAATFHWSLQATSWVLRAAFFVLPVLAFMVTKRWCFGLQHHDEELLHHGIETGIIRRLPSGEYIEVTKPLPEQRARVLAIQLGHDLDAHALPSANGHGSNGHGPNGQSGHAINRPVGVLARARGALEGFFFERKEPVADTDDEPKTLTRP